MRKTLSLSTTRTDMAGMGRHSFSLPLRPEVLYEAGGRQRVDMHSGFIFEPGFLYTVGLWKWNELPLKVRAGSQDSLTAV